MIGIKRLEWDSDFFGYPVGAIRMDCQPVDEESLRAAIRREQEAYRLLYVFLRDDVLLSGSVCSEFNLYLADTKVVYAKSLPAPAAGRAEAEHIRKAGTEDFQALESLALQSGLYSRYRTDVRFADNEYERLYREWLRNSLNGSIADWCLAYYREGAPAGLVTLKERESCTDVGIIAVDAGHRGEGIGTKLLRAVEGISFAKGYGFITVATQKANREACCFYEANGYTVRDISTIYHFWNEHYNSL